MTLKWLIGNERMAGKWGELGVEFDSIAVLCSCNTDTNRIDMTILLLLEIRCVCFISY